MEKSEVKTEVKDQNISLEEVLKARESRAYLQAELIDEYRNPVISFTMNIAGETKRTPLTDFAFYSCIESIINRFGKPRYYHEKKASTGDESIFVYDLPAEVLKRGCIEIEENHPAGRLFDLDVIDVDGKKISRQAGPGRESRTCLVCGGPVYICSRNRAHGLDAIKEKTFSILKNFVANEIGNLAVEAMIEEAELTPKPGLVDSNNNGAHDDMDLNMMLESARALRQYFRAVADLGLKPIEKETFLILKKMGLEAEKNMYEVTGGVNTHRGAIFAMGLISFAIARSLVTDCEVFSEVGEVAEQLDILQEDNVIDISCKQEQSHGDLVRAQYGSSGALGDAMSGFPVIRGSLSYLIDNPEDLLGGFLYTMMNCDDTNLLYRGGPEALSFAKRSAKELLNLTREEREEACLRVDAEFIKKNLSPGGSADMFAASLMLFKMYNRYRYGRERSQMDLTNL